MANSKEAKMISNDFRDDFYTDELVSQLKLKADNECEYHQGIGNCIPLVSSNNIITFLNSDGSVSESRS